MDTRSHSLRPKIEAAVKNSDTLLGKQYSGFAAALASDVATKILIDVPDLAATIELRDTLRGAALQFSSYARQHLDKDPPQFEKSAVNMDWARRLGVALLALPPVPAAPTRSWFDWLLFAGLLGGAVALGLGHHAPLGADLDAAFGWALAAFLWLRR